VKCRSVLFVVDIVTDRSEIWRVGLKIEKRDRRWKDTISVIGTFTVLFSSEPIRSRFIPDFQNFSMNGDTLETLSFKSEASLR